MFMARVIGHVWSTVKWEQLDGLKLLLVRPYHLDELRRVAGEDVATKAREEGVVAADVLGAGPGEDVIVALGHAARAGIEELSPSGPPPSHPIDAAVVAIVDRFSVT
jgi:ethanolamine utilization protein EutN